MQDNKQLFNPDQLSIIEYKMMTGHIEATEDFDAGHIAEYKLEHNFELGFNTEKKLAKTYFSIKIVSDSQGLNKQEAIGTFHFVFVFHIENMDDVAQSKKNNTVNVDANLATALVSIVYSTVRGILLTRLQGTALQNFILPVINPQHLVSKTT